MKFQLLGKIKYWEEAHTDGMSGAQKIYEEFDAEDARKASAKAQSIVKKLVAEYPKRGSNGIIEFRSCEAELREIRPVAKIAVEPNLIKKRTAVVKLENKLTETPF